MPNVCQSTISVFSIFDVRVSGNPFGEALGRLAGGLRYVAASWVDLFVVVCMIRQIFVGIGGFRKDTYIS